MKRLACKHKGILFAYYKATNMESNVLGILPNGRLPVMSSQQIDETHFLFSLDNFADVNHIGVFLTGVAPFPEGTGGAVYLCMPAEAPTNSILAAAAPPPPSWQLLGHICNEKPSAIFRLGHLRQKNGSRPLDSALSLTHVFNAQQLTDSSSLAGQIGVSVEPLGQLLGQTPAANTNVSALASYTEFVQKMLDHFSNYAGSFVVSPTQIFQQAAGGSVSHGEEFVPYKAVHTWFENFRRRIQQDPNFWKS